MNSRIRWRRVLLILVLAAIIYGVSWLVFPDWARTNQGWLVLGALAFTVGLETASKLVEFILHPSPRTTGGGTKKSPSGDIARSVDIRNVRAGGDVIAAAGDILINYAQPTPFGASNEIDARFRDVAGDASLQVEADLRRALEEWREGHKDEANSIVRQIRTRGATWSSLLPTARAKVLRFEARIALTSDNGLSRAKELADEAQKVIPGNRDERLEALITRSEIGPDAALQSLPPNTVDIDTINLRASLLLEVGRTEDCLRLLRVESLGLAPDAETYRLRALVALQKGDIHRARVESLKAKELKSSWLSIQFVIAMVDYWSVISPAAHPPILGPQPVPVQFLMVKCDDESQARLRTAGDTFNMLANNPSNSTSERVGYLLWALACLSNVAEPESQSQAAAICKAILALDPVNFIAIGWAIARDLSIDLSEAERKLKAATENPEPILTLIARPPAATKTKVACQTRDNEG
ncbi:MAG: hypothetical protein IT318_08650 [Anaerolineales bacterium]|nr:hypothetical protein [Anaerolineales bacterium]